MKARALCCLVVFGLLAMPVFAGTYSVSVGYSDGLRGPGFFPSPWDGDPNIVFVGSAAPYDAGAIMITNTSGGTITVNDIQVLIPTYACGGSCNFNNTFDLWGSNTLLAGQSLIVTQTLGNPIYNFDTSDYSGTGCGVNNGLSPVVNVTVNGSTSSFTDSGQVLNTSGYDFACTGANESFGWRPIGTFGGQAGVPEPSSLVLLGTGLIGIGSKAWKRFIG